VIYSDTWRGQAKRVATWRTVTSGRVASPCLGNIFALFALCSFQLLRPQSPSRIAVREYVAVFEVLKRPGGDSDHFYITFARPLVMHFKGVGRGVQVGFAKVGTLRRVLRGQGLRELFTPVE
jgi:hypothetical protein